MPVFDPEDDLDEDIEVIDEETKELMLDYDLEADDAEQVKEIMDEYDLDPDEAIELKDEL